MGVAKKPSGLTMIEVLIALVLLSLGLAGLASMHLGSLQFVHSAHYRSLASTIALDFEERLWLELADASASCPGADGESTVETFIADWTRTTVGDEDWDWTTADPIRIPNLSVEMGTAVTTASVTEIPITLRWGENRIEDVESNSERFDYTIRILCKPGTTGGEST